MTETDEEAIKRLRQMELVCTTTVQFSHAVKLLGKGTVIKKSFHLPPDMRVELGVTWEETVWGELVLYAAAKEISRTYVDIGGSYKVFLQAAGHMISVTEDHAKALKTGIAPLPGPSDSGHYPANKPKVTPPLVAKIGNEVVVSDGKGNVSILKQKVGGS